MEVNWIILAMAGIALVLIFRTWFPNLHRTRKPFPQEWRMIIDCYSTFYRYLDAAGRAKFERDVQEFMRDARVEGIKNFQPDERTRLLVGIGFATVFHALVGRVLLLRRSIIIYPGRSFSEDYKPLSGKIAGLAIPRGSMILAAESILLGFEKPRDGFNPVLHELAHYLDFDVYNMRDVSDDAPMGLTPAQLERWQTVKVAEWEKLEKQVSPLREYALEDNGELFACAVEMFFEDPEPLRDKSPEFYGLLRDYFKLDTCRLYSSVSNC
jgi:Mlc titration factor MtfA (ptsG expression regulator)